MKLRELCDMMRVEIRVRYTPGAVGPWISNLGYGYGEVFFKQDSSDPMARSATGWGATPEASLDDLVRNLRKEKYRLVVRNGHGAEKDRIEYGMPEIDSL